MIIFDAFISVNQTCVFFGSVPVQVQQFSADAVKTGSGLTLIHVGSYDIFKQKGLCAESRKLQSGQKHYSILLCPGQPVVLAKPSSFSGD